MGKCLAWLLIKICNNSQEICWNREKLRTSPNLKKKIQSLENLSFNLKLILSILRELSKKLYNLHPLCEVIKEHLCPLLDNVNYSYIYIYIYRQLNGRMG